MEHTHHEGHSHKCGEHCCGGHGHAAHLSENELELLQTVAKATRLPIVRFVLNSTKSDHFSSVALAPVYLTNANSSMAEVKETGNLLRQLEEHGFIALDYDEKLADGDYDLYSSSAVYHSFEVTVAEAKGRPNFLYDIGLMECGSMALTEAGNQAIATPETV